MALPGLACGLMTTPTPPPALQTGGSAPNFRLSTPFGDKVELNQLKGKVVVVAFWVSWCEDCLQDLLLLQTASERHSGGDFIVLGINPEDAARKVIEISTEYNLTFPLLLDPNHEIADRYHLVNYPSTFIVDSSGSLQTSFVGPLNAAQLENFLASLFETTPRTTSFMLREAFDAPAPALPQPSPTIPPPTPTLALTQLNGCVSVRGLKARSGPDPDAPVLTYFYQGECFRFDARSADGSWLQLDPEWIKNRQRLWVSAAFLELQDDPLRLPVASGGN
jgi:peroxiredoxin